MKSILSEYQAVELAIAIDRRNIDEMRLKGDHNVMFLAMDCIRRFIQAREVDRLHGGNELERRAMENLQLVREKL